MNPFQIITTYWIEAYGYKERIVTPFWLGWILVKMDGVTVPSWATPTIARVLRKLGAYKQLAPVNQKEPSSGKFSGDPEDY